MTRATGRPLATTALASALLAVGFVGCGNILGLVDPADPADGAAGGGDGAASGDAAASDGSGGSGDAGTDGAKGASDASSTDGSEAGAADGASAVDSGCSVLPVVGPLLWFRADDIPGADGAVVPVWSDLSGNAHDAFQEAGARQPVVKRGILNGHSIVVFDGYDDALGLLGATYYSKLSLFIVYRLTGPYSAPGAGHYPFNLGEGDSNGHGWGIETQGPNAGTSPDILDIYTGAHRDQRGTLAGISTYGEWRLITAVTDTNISSTIIRSNGTAAATALVSSDVAIQISLGRSDVLLGGGLGGLYYPDGFAAKTDIAEAVLYSSALTTQQQLDTEACLNAKYGVY